MCKTDWIKLFKPILDGKAEPPPPGEIDLSFIFNDEDPRPLLREIKWKEK